MSLLTRLSRSLVYHGSVTRHDPASTTYCLDQGGVILRGWIVNPGADLALIYLGGNGEDTHIWQSLLNERLPDRTSYLVAYRGYGASDGQPTEQDLVADAVALFADVAKRHARVALLGRSLGSGVAVQAASAPEVRDEVEAVVLVTPFDSADAVARSHSPRWLPAHRVLRDHFRSDLHIGKIRAPILVLRAGQDTVVRPELTDRLVALLPRGARVIDFPRADHQSITAQPGYWPALQQFLEDS